MSTFSGTSGAGLVKFHATSPSASTESVTLRALERGCDAALSTRRVSLIGASATSAIPIAAISAAEGLGFATQAESGSTCSGTGLTSNRTVAMSTPATPSTRAW